MYEHLDTQTRNFLREGSRNLNVCFNNIKRATAALEKFRVERNLSRTDSVCYALGLCKARANLRLGEGDAEGVRSALLDFYTKLYDYSQPINATMSKKDQQP